MKKVVFIGVNVDNAGEADVVFEAGFVLVDVVCVLFPRGRS